MVENQTIEFYKKEVYGKTMFYIKDFKTAANIAVLTKKKTVDWNDLSALQTLGFQIVERISPYDVNFQWESAFPGAYKVI